MSLFDEPSPPYPNSIKTPLAHRMCPTSLDEYVGQEHILAPGKVLRKAIEKDLISSLILFGLPGTGKTALARVVANNTKAHFRWLNATTTGLEELKKLLSEARKLRAKGQRPLLFIDEIHRFNKLQQDALLPDVEEGNVILIAATVENPFFYVNKALISRSQVFELKPLSQQEICVIINRALTDKERGFGSMDIKISKEAIEYLADYSEGDARRALSTLEFIVLTYHNNERWNFHIDLAYLKDALPKKAVSYDKKGDQHYNNISAFIKSMRGSDPDATVYYLARMLYAGEDPRFIARRIVICASEDVGNADPMALVLATSAMRAAEFVGMPEARIILSQAALYVAKAPKSNACYTAIESALKDVEAERSLEVPDHLKDSHYKGAKTMGYGKGYKYPHDFGGYVEQDYLKVKKRYYYP